MICDHLRPLEEELKRLGVKETYRGQAWSSNCREWIYFDCFLDTESLRRRFELPTFVESHVNDDAKSGQERGLVCREHKDAVIGLYEPRPDRPVVK
jgi:hypothetical protein